MTGSVLVDFVSSSFQLDGNYPCSIVSWLFYKLTVMMLLIASLIVTGKQVIETQISCTTIDQAMSLWLYSTLNYFCLVHSPFTVKSAFKQVGDGQAAVGHLGVDFSQSSQERIYYRWYQWVPYALIFQALMFYLLRLLWLKWERHKMSKILKKLKEGEVDRSNVKAPVNYMRRFIICELLNYPNVILQMIFITGFLGHYIPFFTFIRLIFTGLDPNDPKEFLNQIFPHVGMCEFRITNATHQQHKFNVLCVLTLNNLYCIVFTFFMFWFWVLAIISGLNHVLWLLLYYHRKSRAFFLWLWCDGITINEIAKVTNRYDLDQWIVLHLLAKKMNPTDFTKIIRTLIPEPQNYENLSMII